MKMVNKIYLQLGKRKCKLVYVRSEATVGLFLLYIVLQEEKCGILLVTVKMLVSLLAEAQTAR